MDPPTLVASLRRHSSLRYRAYWVALYRRDVPAAERVVDDALRSVSPARIYLRLFEPALNLSGRLWASGAIAHADEHFVTHHTLRLMRRVRRRFVPPAGVADGPLAFATGVAQESHLIGLRMVCDFLHAANWRIHYLSSNERSVVADAVRALRPQAVLLSVGQRSGGIAATRLVAHLRRDGFAGVVAIGGRAVNEEPCLVDRTGADLTARNGAALVRALRARIPSAGRRATSPAVPR